MRGQRGGAKLPDVSRQDICWFKEPPIVPRLTGRTGAAGMLDVVLRNAVLRDTPRVT